MTLTLALTLASLVYRTPIDWRAYRDPDFDGPWTIGRPAWYPEYRVTVYVGVCDPDHATLCHTGTGLCRAWSRPCAEVRLTFGATVGPTLDVR